MKKIGIIGCGVMGEALAKAIRKKTDPNNIYLFDIDEKRVQTIAKEISCQSSSSSQALVKEVDFLILAVKPLHIEKLLIEIAPSYFDKKPVLISIIAGISIETIEKTLLSALKTQGFINNSTFDKNGFDIPCIRLMPNVSVLVEEGMTAFSSNKAVKENEKAFVLDILEKTGKIELVPESLFDAVTAISGSGPAYGFLFIEALADAAVLFGIPRDQAYIYAAQTLKGSAEMLLHTKKHPAILKDSVCSPGGTTIEAVEKLEEKGFRSAIIAAAEAAFNKSKLLAKK